MISNIATRKLTKRFGATLAVFTYIQCALVPAYASDTEVYARRDTRVENSPTLMFLLDTSGSMHDCVDSNNDCTGTANSRYETLKRAMQKVLKGDGTIKPIPGFIKVGLSEYKTDGGQRSGRIVKTARRLDALLSSESPMTRSIQVGSDDVEQHVSGGSQVTTDTSLQLGYDGSDMQYVGLRFSGLSLPKNAVIQTAKLEFTVAESDSDALELDVFVEDVDDAAEYSASSPVASRTYASSFLRQDVPAWTAAVVSPDVPPAVASLDVTSLVQEGVRRNGWCSGSAMAFALVPSRHQPSLPQRVAKSFEGGGAARLVVDYTVDTSLPTCIRVDTTANPKIANGNDDIEWKTGQSSASPQYNELTPFLIQGGAHWNTGLRFALNAPQGTTVSSAKLRLTGATASASALQLDVSVFNTDNATFTCSRRDCDVPAYGVAARSTVTVPAFNANQAVEIDVTSLVRGIISRPGWVAGNAIGFQLVSPSSSSSDASFYAYDGSSSKSPELQVNYGGTQTSYSGVKTVRDDLVETINSLRIEGNTPLGAAYVETASYMMGGPAWNPNSVADSKVTSGGSTSYVSPLERGNTCAGNFIYVLTDGLPTSEALVSQHSDTLMGYGCDNSTDTYTSANQQTWWCFATLGKYLQNSQRNRRQAKVRTSTTLFGPNSGTNWNSECQTVNGNRTSLNRNEACDLRASAIDYGGGEFYTPGSEADLVASINRTVDLLLEESGTISAPGVAVNQLGRLTHLDQLYFAVFDPAVNQLRWEGNVKRYRLDQSGTQTLIVDQNGRNAVDASTGFFAPSRSFWTPTGEYQNDDDSKAVDGGVARRLPVPASRRAYTYLTAYPSLGSSSSPNLTRVDLNDAAFNTAAQAAMNPRTRTGGNDQATVYKNLMYWLAGFKMTADDVYTGGAFVPPTSPTSAELRYRLGAVLHSRPVVVNYGYQGTTAAERAAAEANPSLQDNTLYFSSVEGVLHAVNTNTGIEQFAFLPKELLPAVQDQFDNPAQGVPAFGLDSSWTVWRVDGFADTDNDGDNDIVPDGKINDTRADSVYIYGGMRMGGRNYYALDVTNRSQPKLLWAITPSSNSAFTNIGQTWSQPVLGRLRDASGNIREVVFFGGGYDDKHETAGYTAGTSDADSRGNQIYAVDARTGELIWWASRTGANSNHADMKFAVPSELKLRDLNGDTLTDTIYFGDLGGQVFRVDINNVVGSMTMDNRMKVRLLAKLGQTASATSATTENQRRFYEAPSVARFKDASGNNFAGVALGSGYRSHPLDTDIQESFFFLMDYDAYNSGRFAAGFTPATPITRDNLAVVDTSSTSGVSLTGRKGWYIDFSRAGDERGEKVLASPILGVFQSGVNADGTPIEFYGVIFTTFIPQASTDNTDPCKPALGRSRFWVVNALDGSGPGELNNSLTLNEEGGRAVEHALGLVGEPTRIVTRVGDSTRETFCAGPTCVPGRDLGDPEFVRLRWYEKTPQ